MNVQFIVQGTGEQQYEEMFNYFHGRYPQKLGVYIGYSEENANEYENTGDGFSFANYNAHDMLHVIKYALDVFENHKDRWQEMMQRAMRHDFSWKASAKEYEKLYDMLLGN